MSSPERKARRGGGAAIANDTLSPLIDATAAAALLGVPASWVLAEARAERIPHIRLGRYVRFDRDELRAWAVNGRHRGPRAPTSGARRDGGAT